VSTSGTLVPGDFVILSDRFNGPDLGWWVVGHVETDEGPDLAVALGWAPTERAAEKAVAELEGVDRPIAITGRYLPSEAPQDSDFESKRSSMSVAALINLWADAPDSVYAGYVVSAEPAAGLEAIESPAPDGEVSLNWLNLFYAAEWVIFAGFAVFLWWRLVKDAWEREQEDQAVDEATVE
jgi:surfeit locus 1 family protein